MREYAPPSERPPLGSYAVLMAVFGALFSGALLIAVRGVLAALTISDFLQIAYKAAEEKGLG